MTTADEQILTQLDQSLTPPACEFPGCPHPARRWVRTHDCQHRLGVQLLCAGHTAQLSGRLNWTIVEALRRRECAMCSWCGVHFHTLCDLLLDQGGL